MESERPALPGLVDRFQTPVILHDAETGEILDANPALESLYGYSVDELRSMAVGEFSANHEAFSQTRAFERIRAAAGGEVETFDWHLVRSSGELFWGRVTLSPVEVDGRQCVLGEIEDVSDEKENARRLELLARVIRHNLRNDVNIIVGQAGNLERAVERDDLAAQASTIREAAMGIGVLNDSIRKVETIASSDERRRSTTRVGAVVERVVDDFREGRPAVDFDVEVDDDLWVEADSSLELALEAAITNAIEHNDRETPEVELSVAASNPSGRVEITIRDDGPTIPDNEKDALDATVEKTSTYHGTGVGLWIMKWCAESLGGYLLFDTNDPRGNVVTFSLPRAAPGS